MHKGLEELPDSARVAAAEPEAAPFVWTSTKIAALAVLCVAQLFDVLDATIVNVALPTLQQELGFSPADLQWVINAYTVLFGGFLLLGGRIGDLRGRRRVLLGGIALFTLGSLIAGVTQSSETLVGARGIQGLGAALIAPMTLAIIASIFPEGPARNRAISVWGGVTAVGGSLGLIVGGLLVDGPGWRWIFYINLPFGLILLLAALRFIPKDRPEQRSSRFDFVGAVTSTAGLSLLAYAIAQTNSHPWGSTRTISLLAVAAVLLLYFVLHETKIASTPLFPFRLLRIRPVAGANMIQLVVGGAMYALFYFASLYLQEVRNYSAVDTGLALAPFTFGILVFSVLGPVLIQMIGIRFTLTIGSLVCVGGFIMYSNISTTGSLWANMIAPSLVLSLGLALMFIPVTIASVSGVPSSQNGAASGLLNVNRTVGGALGLAILATLATNHTTDLARTGTDPVDALNQGFGRGFAIAAALMAASAIISVLFFREEGRGEKVNMADIATAGLDK